MPLSFHHRREVTRMTPDGGLHVEECSEPRAAGQTWTLGCQQFLALHWQKQLFQKRPRGRCGYLVHDRGIHGWLSPLPPAPIGSEQLSKLVEHFTRERVVDCDSGRREMLRAAYQLLGIQSRRGYRVIVLRISFVSCCSGGVLRISCSGKSF